jgi:hypothetical protein
VQESTRETAQSNMLTPLEKKLTELGKVQRWGAGLRAVLARPGNRLTLLLMSTLLVGCPFAYDIKDHNSPREDRKRQAAIKKATTLSYEAEALRLLNRCLAGYERVEHRFPSDLRVLGLVGTDCATAQLVEHSPDLSISYRAPTAAANGPVITYLIEVSSRSSPRLRMRSDETSTLYLWFGDEFTAVEGAKEEHSLLPASSGWYGRDGIRAMLWVVVRGAETYRTRHPLSGYPESITEMNKLLVGGEAASGLRAGRLDGYRYVYTAAPRDPDARVNHFRLDVRPVKYGRPWKTSILADEGGHQWSTTEDRAAEPTDVAERPYPW